jgi:hypothetical protein
MKTLFNLFLVVLLLLILQQVASTHSSYIGWHTVAFAAVSSSGNESASPSKDSKLIDDIDKDYQRKINYIIVVVFAVLFSAGIYWWTYGKLHHKLPRY